MGNNQGENAEAKNESEEKPEDIKVAYSKLKAERDKRKDLEDRLAKIEAEETKRAQEKMLEEKKYSELIEQKNKDFAKLQSELEAERAGFKKSKIENLVISEASKLKAKDPYDIIRMVDLGSVEFDDGGKILGLDKILKTVKESKPYLFESEAKEPNQNANARPANQGGQVGKPGSVFEALKNIK